MSACGTAPPRRAGPCSHEATSKQRDGTDRGRTCRRTASSIDDERMPSRRTTQMSTDASGLVLPSRVGRCSRARHSHDGPIIIMVTVMVSRAPSDGTGAPHPRGHTHHTPHTTHHTPHTTHHTPHTIHYTPYTTHHTRMTGAAARCPVWRQVVVHPPRWRAVHQQGGRARVVRACRHRQQQQHGTTEEAQRGRRGARQQTSAEASTARGLRGRRACRRAC